MLYLKIKADKSIEVSVTINYEQLFIFFVIFVYVLVSIGIDYMGHWN